MSPQLGKLISEACDGKKPTDFIVACSDGTHITPNRLRDHFNAVPLVAAYVQALENAAAQAPRARAVYIGVLQSAVAAARASG